MAATRAKFSFVCSSLLNSGRVSGSLQKKNFCSLKNVFEKNVFGPQYYSKSSMPKSFVHNGAKYLRNFSSLADKILAASDSYVNEDTMTISTKINDLYNDILGSNWNDYWVLVMNQPFWESEFNKIQAYMYKNKKISNIKEIQYYESPDYGDINVINSLSKTEEPTKMPPTYTLSEEEEKQTEENKDFLKLQKLMNVLYIAEDIRDHIDELLESACRATGIAGIGILPHPAIDNSKDHAVYISTLYEYILAKFPELSPKIHETIGNGIALLRQKEKFQFKRMHSYFF